MTKNENAATGKTATGKKKEIKFIEGNYQFNAYYHGKKPQALLALYQITRWRPSTSLRQKKVIRYSTPAAAPGLLTWFLAKSAPAQVWGIDGNQSAIDFCQSAFQLPNLHFAQAIIDELPYGDGSFNKIAFLEVIEHISLSQGSKVLQKFYDILPPGGTLVISTPNKQSLWPLIEYLLDIFKLVPTLSREQHEHLYTGRQLKKLAEQSGFHCVSQKTINFLSPWVAAVNEIRPKSASAGTKSQLPLWLPITVYFQQIGTLAWILAADIDPVHIHLHTTESFQPEDSKNQLFRFIKEINVPVKRIIKNNAARESHQLISLFSCDPYPDVTRLPAAAEMICSIVMLYRSRCRNSYL